GHGTADMLYASPSLRVAQDLDLLVRSADGEKARRVLLNNGYRPEHTFNPKQEAAYLAEAAGFAFNSPHQGAIIDLQWRIAPPRFGSRIAHEEFWERPTTTEIQGR